MKRVLSAVCMSLLLCLCLAGCGDVTNPSVSTAESAANGEVLAYAAKTFNSKSLGVGSVYLVESYLTTEHINPATGKAFTKAEIKEVLKQRDVTTIGEDYAMGVTTEEGVKGGINEYTISEADSVMKEFAKGSVHMDPESGSLFTEEKGKITYLVEHAFAILIAANNPERNISNVYYPLDCLSTDYVNPYTGTYFTQEDVDSFLTNEDVWVLYGGAHMMIEPYSTGALWSYDAEESLAIASYEGAYTINPANGAVLTSDGQTLAEGNPEQSE